MFTGIIQSKGSIKEIISSREGARLKINTNALDLSDSKVGDSIAVDGVCLTVTQLSGDGLQQTSLTKHSLVQLFQGSKQGARSKP